MNTQEEFKRRLKAHNAKLRAEAMHLENAEQTPVKYKINPYGDSSGKQLNYEPGWSLDREKRKQYYREWRIRNKSKCEAYADAKLRKHLSEDEIELIREKDRIRHLKNRHKRNARLRVSYAKNKQNPLWVTMETLRNKLRTKTGNTSQNREAYANAKMMYQQSRQQKEINDA